MKTIQLFIVTLVAFASLSAQAGFLDELKKAKKYKDEIKKLKGDVTHVCRSGAFDRKVQVEDKDKNVAEKKAYDECLRVGNSWVYCNVSCDEKVN